MERGFFWRKICHANHDKFNKMASELVKQNQTYHLEKLPRATQLGPLSYGEWDLNFVSFFMSFSEQQYGAGAARIIQGCSPQLIDQFLTIDQADLDACYEAHKERGLPKVDGWGQTLMAFFEHFNDYVANNLDCDPQELVCFTHSFLGIRLAQAALSMKGEVPASIIKTLNSKQLLGAPEINVQLFC
ncbi:hypothetical protein COT42_05335 [Candidatus Saganbacteria bacterium CG08_land_8_20_14_0_20_45_16]|uniref:Uncharacterized protein n=1 Tax=Candidatus Saganbacteria bacterium CG08_land_8_20_14_0_20_45_16 TaxID=2014293 RepID=A0A2H0XWZ5_UNCSA|nr:MAG: hypothetical protein COT42_05335 [Candidatus Saganbacteria bacterium CG08_land_8_20_14_0_20_45_16]